MGGFAPILHSTLSSLRFTMTTTDLPTLDGPFYSWQEVENQKKAYEDAHHVQLLRRRSTTIAQYRKRAPNRPISDALENVAFQLNCVKTGSYTSRGAGSRPNTSTLKTGCTFFLRYKLSPDGDSLVLGDKCEEHNHDLSKVCTELVYIDDLLV